MDSMTDDQHSQNNLSGPARWHVLDMEVATRVSLAVLISAPRASALTLAVEIAMGSGADGMVVVHAADSFYLRSALRRAASADLCRPRAVVVHDVDALGPAEQSTLMAALADIARHGANPYRIIATTSVPLFERVRQGSFDAGLFYCLNQVHIKLGTVSSPDNSAPRRTAESVEWTPPAHLQDEPDRISGD